MAYLVEIRVINSIKFCQFMIGILDQNIIQKDLIYHCILIALTTENVSNLI